MKNVNIKGYQMQKDFYTGLILIYCNKVGICPPDVSGMTISQAERYMKALQKTYNVE